MTAISTPDLTGRGEHAPPPQSRPSFKCGTCGGHGSSFVLSHTRLCPMASCARCGLRFNATARAVPSGDGTWECFYQQACRERAHCCGACGATAEPLTHYGPAYGLLCTDIRACHQRARSAA